eukprot:m.441613 g.441613  ORF g.441613 m.441613 type:complete len:174 (+) comp20282_c2_seq29:1242-1763(+)
MPPDKERERSSSSSSSSSSSTSTGDETTSVPLNSVLSAGNVFGQPHQDQEHQGATGSDMFDAELSGMHRRGPGEGSTLVMKPSVPSLTPFGGEWDTDVSQQEESFTSESSVWLEAIVDAALADVHTAWQVQRRAQDTEAQAESAMSRLALVMDNSGTDTDNSGTDSSGSDPDC